MTNTKIFIFCALLALAASAAFGRPVVTSDEREIDNYEVSYRTFLNIEGVSIYLRRRIKELARRGFRIG